MKCKLKFLDDVMLIQEIYNPLTLSEWSEELTDMFRNLCLSFLVKFGKRAEMGEVILLPLPVALPSVACFYNKTKANQRGKTFYPQSTEDLLTCGFVAAFAERQVFYVHM